MPADLSLRGSSCRSSRSLFSLYGKDIVYNRNIFMARRVGHAAAKLLQNDSRASLRGHTSKGVYIQTESRWILFLSFGRSVGPLTITVEQDVTDLDAMQPGAMVEIQDRSLQFPSEGVTIDTRQAEMWHVPPVPALPSTPEEQLERVRFLAQQAVTVKQGLGLSVLLPHLLWPEAADMEALDSSDSTAWEGVTIAKQGLVTGTSSSILKGAEYLLGRGRGLTPSGDDFFLGIMLALNRWKMGLLPLSQMAQLERDIISLSYEKTTALSGNLIECAVKGEADERLLALVDSIFCGIPAVGVSVRPMLTWGSSSGVDVMTGMAVAVLASSERTNNER